MTITISVQEKLLLKSVFEGENTVDYASKVMCITAGQVRHRMRKLGFYHRDKKPTALDENDDSLCYELRRGFDCLSYQSIADKFEVSVTAVMSGIERHKTKLLESGETLESI